MSNEVENQTIDINLCAAHPMNYNEHPVGQIANLRTSLRKFDGQVRSIVVQDDGAGGYLLVAGHGIHEAATMEGFETLRADVIPADWPPAKVIAYLAADNELARDANPDEEKRARLVAQVGEEGDDVFAMLAAGSEERLREMLEEAAEKVDGLLGKGSALALIDVTIADPIHIVDRGDVWSVGPHTLICVDVFTDWMHWRGFLDGDNLFAPFPGPFVPFVERKNGETFVMVQPDQYIAGHILDRWDEVNQGSPAKKEGNLLN